MKELSPLAKQLVEAGRSAYQPDDADKHRIHEALQARLPATPDAPPQNPGEPSVPPKPWVPPGAPWALVSAVTVGAGILVGALYWGLASRDPAPAASAPRASVPSPSVPQGPPPTRPSPPERPPAAAAAREAPEAPPPAKAKPAAPASPAKEPETTRAKSRLADEVALMSKATSALNAGRAEEALEVLAEHQRKFPRGLLSVERRGARAQALCLLGRKAEAERELERLSPSSPQAARARQLCAQ